MEPYQYILEDLLKVPGSLPAGQDEIRMLCPVCRHPKPKLYVGLYKALLPKKVLTYDCKHCQFQGGVGPKFLKMFNVEPNQEYLEGMKKQSRSSTKIINPVTKMEKMDLKIPDRILQQDEFKVKYLEGRFGRKITVKDLKTYKIVLNFNDFFEFNNVDPTVYIDKTDERKYQYQLFLFNEYTNHFVGMLSVDNNKLNLRNINSKALANKRYMVHTINKSITNPYMYMPDIPIDIMSVHPTINMAEGNYDIIGAKETYFLNEDYSDVFVAVGTRKAYKRVLNQIMKMTGFINAKINIFADNDGDINGMNNIDFYKDLFKEFRPLYEDITLNYNVADYTDENGRVIPCKDFGNLSHPIKLEKVEI